MRAGLISGVILALSAAGCGSAAISEQSSDDHPIIRTVRTSLEGQTILCSAAWAERGAASWTFHAMPTCTVSIDGTVVSCPIDASGQCTIPMPDGSDVATAQVDFAFDANDPAFPAGATCEQAVGSLVRDGDKLRYSSQIACASDPAELPSATRTTISCSVYADLPSYAPSGIPGVSDYQPSAYLGSCDALANGAPVTCATQPAPVIGFAPFSCELPWQPGTLFELGQRDPAADGFGRPTKATCGSPVAFVRLIGSSFTLRYSESCTPVQAGAVTINNDDGRDVPARPDSFPVVDWTADSGDCVLDSYHASHGNPPRHSDFVSGVGLTGDTTATTAMGSPIGNHGAPDRQYVVLSCTDEDGAVSQTIKSVYASCFGDPLPLCLQP
jgi:hypothetical protein